MIHGVSGGFLDDSKKFLMVMIPGAFVAFMVVVSLITGANPIESFFMLIWQILLYAGGLIVFGTPVFMLVAFATMSFKEETKEIYDDPDEHLRKNLRKKSKKAGVPPAPVRNAPEQVTTRITTLED